jgi:hypothetical protein
MKLVINCAKGGARSSGVGKYPPVIPSSAKVRAPIKQTNVMYLSLQVNIVTATRDTEGKTVPEKEESRNIEYQVF